MDLRSLVPPLPAEVINLSGSTSQSTGPLENGARYAVYANAGADVHVRWGGSAPTAVTTDLRIVAGQWFDWVVETGRDDYVAMIPNSGTQACQVLKISGSR